MSVRASEILQGLRLPVKRRSSWFTQIWVVFWVHTKILFSYKLGLATEVLSVVATVAVYFFAGFLVQRGRLIELGYGSDYLSFAIIGIATADFARISLVRLSAVMHEEIRTGTFETVLSSQIRLSAYLAGQALRGLLLGLVFFSSIMVAGVAVSSAQLNTNLGALAYSSLVMILMAAANLGLGFVAASLVLIHKRASTVNHVVGNLMQFLSGVIYPLRLLEAYPVLHYASLLLPYTYGLDGMRKVLLTDMPLDSPILALNIVALLLFLSIAFPLGAHLFGKSYDRVRREGSTGTY